MIVDAEISSENVENQSVIGNVFDYITSNKEIDCYIKYANETYTHSFDGKLDVFKFAILYISSFISGFDVP